MHVLACPKTVMTMYLSVGGGEIFDLANCKADRRHHQLLAVCITPGMNSTHTGMFLCLFTLVTTLTVEDTEQA